MDEAKHIFIIGSKGIPAGYGGFETFVQELVTHRRSDTIKYHVACYHTEAGLAEQPFHKTWQGVDQIMVPVRNIGSGKAVIYDLKALDYCLSYIESQKIRRAVIYILTSRIGPFISRYKKQCQRLGIPLLINPDGHEWKRAKWNKAIKEYWKISERGMVKNADLVVCDSLAIQKYIKNKYQPYRPKTCFISYGADSFSDIEKRNILLERCGSRAKQWLAENNVLPGQYYLVVGRFVPENNYECILKEFMRSETERHLLIIANSERSKYYRELESKTGFLKDKRIRFAGTLYDRDLLTAVRLMAFAYIHGHSVGGTNPSLLEAMGTTDINLLYDVSYNREAGQKAVLYWNKKDRSLSELINKVEGMTEEERLSYGVLAKKRIENDYSWDNVVSKYESLFFSLLKDKDR